MTPPASKTRPASAAAAGPQDAGSGRSVLLALHSCGCVTWHGDHGPDPAAICRRCGFGGTAITATIPITIPE